MATNDIAPPENVAELRSRIEVAWETLESALASVSGSQLEVPHRGGWNIKDQLAHIAEWERASAAVIRHRPQASGFGFEADEYARYTDVDSLNQALFERNRGLSYGEVLDRARAAHAELLSALDTLADGDLQRPVSEYGFGPDDRRTLLEKIAGDSYAHYAEHTAWIQEIVA